MNTEDLHRRQFPPTRQRVIFQTVPQLTGRPRTGCHVDRVTGLRSGRPQYQHNNREDRFLVVEVVVSMHGREGFLRYRMRKITLELIMNLRGPCPIFLVFRIHQIEDLHAPTRSYNSREVRDNGRIRICI